MKKFLIAAILTAAAASPSFAATTHHHHRRVMTPDQSMMESYAMAPSNNTVVQDGQVIGADPDPFIREQLLREGNPADYSGG